MELTDIYYNKADYVETASGNKVCRQTILCGSQNIILNGKVIIQAEAMIRGDLASVRAGRYCIISKKAVIRPPCKKFRNGFSYFPLAMGEHIFVGENTLINSASVGSYVHIGRNCVIGQRSILKECCIIEDDTIIPPETVVPPFTRFGGSPGQCTGTVPECMQDIMAEYTRSYYQHFVPSRLA